MQGIENFIQKNKINLIKVAVVVFVLFGINTCIKNSTKIPTQIDKNLSAYYAAQPIIKKNLLAPSSANFQAYDPSLVQKNGNGTYTVKAYVDHKNAFGVEIRSNFKIVLEDKPEGWTPKGLIMN